MLIRYWFEFQIPSAFGYPPGIGHGCGVTAYSLEDAYNLLDERVFYEIKRPPFKKVVENVDIQTLDQNHVIPNMKLHFPRGIWFPLGYD